MALAAQQYWEHMLQTQRYSEPKRLLKFGAKAYSQHDEDGMLFEIFSRIGVQFKAFVEIGVGDGLENNTLALLVNGWRGFWIDGDLQNVEDARRNLAAYVDRGILKIDCHFVTRQNIERVLETGDVGEPDCLSIDIDGNDYWIWDVIHSVSPRVVVVEYNASWFPPLALVVPYSEHFCSDGSNYFGASLKALEMLGSRKGYRLVGCDFSGTNAFFVRIDLCQDHFCAPFTAENHFEPPRYWIGGQSGHRPGIGLIESVTSIQSP